MTWRSEKTWTETTWKNPEIPCPPHCLTRKIISLSTFMFFPNPCTLIGGIKKWDMEKFPILIFKIDNVVFRSTEIEHIVHYIVQCNVDYIMLWKCICHLISVIEWLCLQSFNFSNKMVLFTVSLLSIFLLELLWQQDPYQ